MVSVLDLIIAHALKSTHCAIYRLQSYADNAIFGFYVFDLQIHSNTQGK